jgi:hypothetical protein
MRALQVREFATFGGVVGKFVVWEDGARNNVSSHVNASGVGCAGTY